MSKIMYNDKNTTAKTLYNSVFVAALSQRVFDDAGTVFLKRTFSFTKKKKKEISRIDKLSG